MNQQDIIAAFKAAMLDHGIEPPQTIKADGILHRFHIAGQRSGSLNGAYKLHLDGARPAGYFEDFRSGVKATWKADGPPKQLTNEERQRLQAAKRKADADREAKYKREADIARRQWAQAKPINTRDEHPYLVRKQIQPHGLRLLPFWQKRYQDEAGSWQNLIVRNVLLVPLVDIHNQLWNVQAIFAEKVPALKNRDKDFRPGRVGGLFAWIGDPTPERIICEGFATGASLYEATGFQTFCAMSANNLRAVAEAIRKHRPNAKIIIAADNDADKSINTGVKSAKEAARAVGGLLCVSPIGDFNDFANDKGAA